MKHNNLFRIFFAFSDLFALNLLNLVLLRQLTALTAHYYDYSVFSTFTNMAWLMCSYVTSVYINNNLLNYNRLFKRTLVSATIYLALIFIFGRFFNLQSDRLYMLYSVNGFFLFLLVSRLSFAGIISLTYRKEQYQRKIAFIGCNKLSKELITHFQTNTKIASITGFFDDKHKSNDTDYPVLGKISECIKYARENGITEIYSTLSPKSNPQLNEIAAQAESSFIRFKFIPDLSEFTQNSNCSIEFIEDTPILSMRREPLESMPGRIKKRVFDIIFSSFIIVFVLSWLIPILAIIIKFDSEGPVFFTQVRSGKNNLPFNCLKLRTLRVNPDADSVQVTRGDNRITKVGAFLRKTNLDELPQFMNVLMGDMSIVGSRPHMLKHTEEYSKMIDNYMVRHYAKPGVTGWAQINGHRGEIKQHEQLKQRVDHDIWYLENWNLWLDVRIVFMTLYTTIKGDKNAF